MELQKLTENNLARVPRLDTVLAIEEFIKQNSAKYSVYQLWKNLPKKIMYPTYKIIITYLLEINKIAIDSENKIGYIWNQKLGLKYKEQEDLNWD